MSHSELVPVDSYARMIYDDDEEEEDDRLSLVLVLVL
jgi:hypothetical protein